MNPTAGIEDGARVSNVTIREYQVHVWGCPDHGTWYGNMGEEPKCPICGATPTEDYGVIP